MTKRWQIHPALPSHLRESYARAGIDPLLGQLLYNRGVASPEEADAFLHPVQEQGDPFLLPEMDRAVNRLRQAIHRAEKIVVYGDYDADGVTATALLADCFQSLGARVEAFIPNRADEGYGLHIETLRELRDRGCTLVITVDCGIRSVDEARWAQEHGLDLVITDHHSPAEALPPAVARVDPKLPDSRYPFAELSGVGVAYKLAQALLRTQRQMPVRGDTTPVHEEDLLDLVVLGTVADLAPLVGENRVLVKQGLERINQTQRPGLRELIAASNLQGTISAGHIGYVLGPRLNAAGRLDTAMVAYRLLTTRSPDEARSLARELDERNRERQRLTIEAVEKARRLALAEDGNLEPLLFIADADILGGIAGLVASKLTEEFYRPSVVIQIADDISRGSARSIPEFNITSALDACAHLLVRHGGHAAAAGFEVENRLLDDLRNYLVDCAQRQLEGEDLVATLVVDAEVPLSHMTWDTMRLIDQLEPHGYGNPRPVFVSRRVQVKDSRVVGDRHLKLMVSDGKQVWDAIAFRQAERISHLAYYVDLVYALEINTWNGQDRLQLNVKDLSPSQG